MASVAPVAACETTAMASTQFPVGTRVTIHGHSEWPEGTAGTIAAWPGAVRELIEEPRDGDFDDGSATLERRGQRNYWVRFDVPTDDGSGDGPYGGAEVDARYLRHEAK